MTPSMRKNTENKDQNNNQAYCTILLVDPDTKARESLAVMLRKEIGCVVLEAGSTEDAQELLNDGNISLLLTDLFLPKREGIALLKETHASNPEIITIAAIPSGNREIITEVLRLGTFFYINSPYDYGEAVIAVSRGLNYSASMSQEKKASVKSRKSEGFHGIIGDSSVMQNLFYLISKVADDDISTVLIHGESGTGKELVAQAIHAHSPRKGKNLVPVNCTAIPDELLESELFGYVKGAFTGATKSKMGRIQYADGGTLFLDEIGDMKPSLQAKLLRVLQEKEFEPVGGLKPIPANVRIIAATHCDLEDKVASGNFREDLFYRLSVVPINIPPLRERKPDIPILINKFVQIFNRNKKKPLQGFESETIEQMQEYPWRGNVRELENLVQHMSILHGGKKVALTDLPPKYTAHIDNITTEPDPVSSEIQHDQELELDENGIDFNTLVDNYERKLILQALEVSKGNKKEAAKLLNLKRTTLLEKIKKKNIIPDS